MNAAQVSDRIAELMEQHDRWWGTPEEVDEAMSLVVKGGRIQGVGRYDYTQPPTVQYTQSYIDRLLRHAGEDLAAIGPHMPIADHVFDSGYRAGGLPILTESYPYGRSDPCFFRSYDRIDGYTWQ